MATNENAFTPAKALAAALADLAFDSRGAFIVSAPAPMTKENVDKILDAKGITWDSSNRHIKAEARKIWIAGGPATQDFDKRAVTYFEAHPLTKGSWKNLANRALDAIADGAADVEAAWTNAVAKTKAATEKEKAQTAFNRGHQMVADSLAQLGLSKDDKARVMGLIEGLGKFVR